MANNCGAPKRILTPPSQKGTPFKASENTRIRPANTDKIVLTEEEVLRLSRERLFNEGDITRIRKLSVDAIKRILESMGDKSPDHKAYTFPRSSQVSECNNEKIGDGMLFKHIRNINTLKEILHGDSGIGPAPDVFRK